MEIIRTATLAAGLGLTAASLGSCATSPELQPNHPGVIVEHEYDDADIVTFKPLIIDPEHFILHIRQCGLPAERSGEEECRTVEVEVSEEQYATYSTRSELSAEEINDLSE